jgi:hypothetical protein
MGQFRALRRRLRITLAATGLALGWATSGEAAPLLIGSFSYVEGPDFAQTFQVEAFAADWPGGLVLSDVYVEFTRPSGSGSAYFDGDFATCTGNMMTLDSSSGALQSAGDFLACGGALPQDITSAVLKFTFDTLLGTVTVDPLVAMLNGGEPSGDLQGIFFEAADVAAVPEPASLTLLATGVTGIYLRRRRSRHR